MADDVAPGIFALDLPELALQLADLVICRVRVGDVLAPLPRPTTMARVDRPRSICGVLYRDCILPPPPRADQSSPGNLLGPLSRAQMLHGEKVEEFEHSADLSRL